MLYRLITLASIFALAAKSEEDGEFYSDDESAEMDGGLGVSLYQDEGEPVVLFYRGNDAARRVYCFRFVGSFEANGYVDAGDDSEIDGSAVDFGDDIDWNYQGPGGEGEDAFSFRIYSMGQDKWDELNLTFSEIAMEDGYTALKFDITIRDYMWSEDASEESSFVMQVDLDDCSDAYSQERSSQSVSSESGSEDGESEDDGASGSGEGEDDEESGDEAEEARRLINFVKVNPKQFMAKRTDIKQSRLFNLRKLLQDDEESHDEDGEDDHASHDHDEEESDSADSSEGVSSDDSREYDLEAAIFQIEDTATGEFGPVNVSLHYEPSDDSLEMVFGYFGANLDMDPTLAMDSDKVDTDGAISLFSVSLSSLILALVAMAL